MIICMRSQGTTLCLRQTCTRMHSYSVRWNSFVPNRRVSDSLLKALARFWLGWQCAQTFYAFPLWLFAMTPTSHRTRTAGCTRGPWSPCDNLIKACRWNGRRWHKSATFCAFVRVERRWLFIYQISRHAHLPHRVHEMLLFLGHD